MLKHTTIIGRTKYSRILCTIASLVLVIFVYLTLCPIASISEDASATINHETYALSLATSQYFGLDITPSVTGSVNVTKDTIVANTASPSGYKLYLSVNSGRDNYIYLNDDANNSTADKKFIPATGTFAAPAPLALSDTIHATWGFAIAGANGFDAAYSTTNPSANAKFAAVPVADNAQLIYEHSGTATNVATDVYYGAAADLSISSGTYITEIVYTAMTDVSSLANGEANITPTSSSDGYLVTINTSLSTTREIGDIVVNLNDGAQNGVCSNVTITNRDPLSFTCEVPASLAPSTYDVIINLPDLDKLYVIYDGYTVTGAQVSIIVNEASAGYGTVSNSGLIEMLGTPVSTSGNTLTIGTNTVTATPAAASNAYTHSFSGWTNNCGSTITDSCTIIANFTRIERSYTVTWNGNGGTPSTPSTSKTYNSAIGTLPTATRNGYRFDGWFTSDTGGTQISATTTVTANVTYYAHWTIADITSITNMQEITATICNNTANGTQHQLIDTRDNKLYWVAKLADGHCWMTQNLDYDIKTTDNIVSKNDGTTTTWSPNRATSTSAYNNSTSSATYSYDPGSYYSANGTNSSNTAITCTSANNGGENCHYHLGNYYQFNAAAAGSATNNQDASQSICPQGWRLPTSNSTTANYSFGAMTPAQNFTNNSTGAGKIVTSPFYAVRSGYIRSGSVYNRGSYAYYWSSRAYSSGTYAYALLSTSTTVNPSSRTYRYYGFAVRCVAI